MEESIIGGILMARSYRHVSEYEEEILRMKAEGKTKREIGETLGLNFDQIHNFLKRYNEKQRRSAAGLPIRKKGRTPKDYQISENDKPAELRYMTHTRKVNLLTKLIPYDKM